MDRMRTLHPLPRARVLLLPRLDSLLLGRLQVEVSLDLDAGGSFFLPQTFLVSYEKTCAFCLSLFDLVIRKVPDTALDLWLFLFSSVMSLFR